MATALHRLHARYENLERQEHRELTEDQQRSLTYYRLDSDGLPDPALRDRVSVWVRSVRALHAFAVREGRLPRENNRLQQGQISVEERRLADWLRYQRRPATRANHCTYQGQRLEAVPGFQWDPLGQAWATNFAAYRLFTQARRRAPSSRSLGAAERRLALWAAKQRHHHKRGRLAPARVDALNTLPIWVWGT